MPTPAPRVPLEAVAALTECPCPATLGEAIDRLVRAMGVQYWLYAVDLPLTSDRHEAFTLGDYPPAWVAHYLERGYLHIDPVVSHCLDHATPILWSAGSKGTKRLSPHGRRVREMFEEATGFGLGAGLSIPLNGPGAIRGLMSFAGARGLAGTLRTRAAELHLLAHFVHEAARRFASPGDPIDPPRLTGRERESLSWASTGKTSWEIARLLGISERTVVFHIRNASEKLGVSGRQAAIARAVALGLISSR